MGYFSIFTACILGFNIFATKVLKQKWMLWTGYGFTFLAVAVFMWKMAIGGGADFIKAYYPSGVQVLQDPMSLYYSHGAEMCYGFDLKAQFVETMNIVCRLVDICRE